MAEEKKEKGCPFCKVSEDTIEALKKANSKPQDKDLKGQPKETELPKED